MTAYPDIAGMLLNLYIWNSWLKNDIHFHNGKKSEASEVVGIPEHTVKRKLKLTIFVILNKLLISQKFKNQDHVSSYCWSYSQPVWSQKLPSGCGQDQINTLAEQQNGAGERAFAQILRQKLGQNTHKYQGPTPRNLAPCTGPFLCGPNHWNHNIESVRFQCIMLIVDTVVRVSPLGGQSKARKRHVPFQGTCLTPSMKAGIMEWRIRSAWFSVGLVCPGTSVEDTWV